MCTSFTCLCCPLFLSAFAYASKQNLNNPKTFSSMSVNLPAFQRDTAAHHSCVLSLAAWHKMWELKISPKFKNVRRASNYPCRSSSSSAVGSATMRFWKRADHLRVFMCAWMWQNAQIICALTKRADILRVLNINPSLNCNPEPYLTITPNPNSAGYLHFYDYKF